MPPFLITTALYRALHAANSQALSVASTASMDLGQTRDVREYYQALRGSHDDTSESYTQGSQRYDEILSPPLLDSREVASIQEHAGRAVCLTLDPVDAADTARVENRPSAIRITNRKRAPMPPASAAQDRQEACQYKGKHTTTKTNNPPEALHAEVSCVEGRCVVRAERLLLSLLRAIVHDLGLVEPTLSVVEVA